MEAGGWRELDLYAHPCREGVAEVEESNYHGRPLVAQSLPPSKQRQPGEQLLCRRLLIKYQGALVACSSYALVSQATPITACETSDALT